MKLILIGLIAVVGLSACSEVYPGMKEREAAIRQCIADGGTPQYTTNKHGRVIDYFGCVNDG